MSLRREEADLKRALLLSTQQARAAAQVSPHTISSAPTDDSHAFELRPIQFTATTTSTTSPAHSTPIRPRRYVLSPDGDGDVDSPQPRSRVEVVIPTMGRSSSVDPLDMLASPGPSRVREHEHEGFHLDERYQTSFEYAPLEPSHMAHMTHAELSTYINTSIPTSIPTVPTPITSVPTPITSSASNPIPSNTAEGRRSSRVQEKKDRVAAEKEERKRKRLADKERKAREAAERAAERDARKAERSRPSASASTSDKPKSSETRSQRSSQRPSQTRSSQTNSRSSQKSSQKRPTPRDEPAPLPPVDEAAADPEPQPERVPTPPREPTPEPSPPPAPAVPSPKRRRSPHFPEPQPEEASAQQTTPRAASPLRPARTTTPAPNGYQWKARRDDLSSVLAKFPTAKRTGMSRRLKIAPLHATIGPGVKALPPPPPKKKAKVESEDEDSDDEGKVKVGSREWLMMED